MDQWNGLNFIKNNQDNWLVYKTPPGEVRIKSNVEQSEASTSITATQALTDSDATTEYRVDWWPQNKYTPFPHIFEIDMNETNTFKAIKIGRTGNTGFYSMNSYLQIFLAPYNYSTTIPPIDVNSTETTIPYSSSNYSINHAESIIWEGYFNTDTMEIIEFEKHQKGRYIKLAFINNSRNWKDGHPGRTCISTFEVGNQIHNKKIYPMTNTKYFTRKNRWDEKRNGFYYNGKGFTGYAKNAAPNSNNNKANSILEIRIPKFKPEFGIVGDYYPGMGIADVKLDGTKIGKIGQESLDKAGDERRLKLCSRSYRSILFYISDLDPNKQHTLTFEVTKGEITLAGILTHQMVIDYNTDDWRYPRILATEFDKNPEQYDWFTPSDQIGPYKPPKKKGGLSGGAIAGIVICVLVVVAAAVVGVFFMYKKELLCFGGGGGGRFQSTSSLI